MHGYQFLLSLEVLENFKSFSIERVCYMKTSVSYINLSSLKIKLYSGVSRRSSTH